MAGFGDYLGLGNPYDGAPALAQPNRAAYDVPGASAIQGSLGSLQGFANGPGVQVDTRNSDQSRAQQQQVIDLLLGTANGTSGPSAAQVQMGRGLDQALGNNRALSQSMAANNPIAALQAASGQGALLQRQVIGDASQMRAQEQLAARGQLNDALSSMRYGDVATQAQHVQAGLGNQTAHLGALNAILGGNVALSGQQQQGAMGYENARMNTAQQEQQNFVAGRTAELAARRQLLGTVLQTAGTVGAAFMSGGGSLAGAAAGGAAGAAGTAISNAAIGGGTADPRGMGGGGGYRDPYGQVTNPYR